MSESNADKGTMLHRIGLSGMPYWFYMSDGSVHHGSIAEIDTAGFFTLNQFRGPILNSAQLVRVSKQDDRPKFEIKSAGTMKANAGEYIMNDSSVRATGGAI